MLQRKFMYTSKYQNNGSESSTINYIQRQTGRYLCTNNIFDSNGKVGYATLKTYGISLTSCLYGKLHTEQTSFPGVGNVLT